ncbi:MAG: hypothetical protein ACE5EN_08560 [Nitrospinota bacterium]
MSRLKVYAGFFMLAFALAIAGCGGTSSDGGGSSKTTSNDVFTCTTGSAAPKSRETLFRPVPVKPRGSATGTIVKEGGVILYATGTSTISGKVEYEDRTFNSTGFTGIANMPVRFARVQAVENGTTVLKETTAAADGSYTLSSFAHGAGAITVRALTDTVSSYAATVRDSRDSSIYAVVSADLSSSLPATLSNQNLLADVSGAGPAFNIFDNMILAQEGLQQFAPATPLSQITAYWYSGGQSSICVTCYTNSKIYLSGLSSDDDSYDDTVILHELGHYAAAAYSRDDSPGGSHTLTGHYDLRLAWSEGWATFFGSLVRAVSGVSSPEYYVDTATTTWSYEIESITAYNTNVTSANTLGADNEVAVSAVLWDIYDANNEGAWDTLSMGWTEIWSIFDNDLPTASVATFETFWDKWETTAYSGQLAPLMAATGRDIRYSADTYESGAGDDTSVAARTVAAGTSEQHTFFPAGDKDWLKISVTNGTQYTFKTESLGDGADTLLTLYDSDGTTPKAQNDDDPDKAGSSSKIQRQASKIVCTAKVDRTIYILAEPYRQLTTSDPDYDAASNPTAVAKYGYYTLTITSP